MIFRGMKVTSPSGHVQIIVPPLPWVMHWYVIYKGTAFFSGRRTLKDATPVWTAVLALKVILETKGEDHESINDLKPLVNVLR